jgi:hypothetical protein
LAAFTAYYVLCVASPGRPFARAFFSGPLFNFDFIVKYVAIFEAPAVAFLFLYVRPLPLSHPRCSSASAQSWARFYRFWCQ